MKLRRRLLNLIKKTQEKIFRFGGRAIRPDLSRRAHEWWRWEWRSIMRRCAARCWGSTSGVGARSTAKRRERKEHCVFSASLRNPGTKAGS